MLPVFDKEYYIGIWGTIHRHDYCENLANQLIGKYGKCKVLDIGTGCGFLVKLLRELGCDAWGLEVSEYAVNNSCCPAFVVPGTIWDIPFKDNFFDVVVSQGVWEYVPEDYVFKAKEECYRVGGAQYHTIDYVQICAEEQFVTERSQEWWDEKLTAPKILVGCPTHICKEYAMQRWIDRVKQLTYKNIDILMVDNSPDTAHYERWRSKIPMRHIEVKDTADASVRIARSMEILRQKFISNQYSHWLNLEVDVIPPIDIIELLLKYGQGADWISHGYPDRNGDPDLEIQQGVGCSLFSRRLMEKFELADAGDAHSVDAWLWDHARRDRSLKTIELWNVTKLRHLGELN